MLLQKDTLAINTETLCELRVTKKCNKEVGDIIKLSNKLNYVITSIEDGRLLVVYANALKESKEEITMKRECSQCNTLLDAVDGFVHCEDCSMSTPVTKVKQEGQNNYMKNINNIHPPRPTGFDK